MAKIIPTNTRSKKDVVVVAAAALFREKGYPATSMRHIAESLSVEAPSLYNHIDSKKELLELICMRVADEFITNLKQVEATGLTPLEKIERIMRFHIRMMMRDHLSVHVAEHEWRHLEEPAYDRFKTLRNSYRKRVAGILEAGIAENQIAKVDPQVTILTIISAINGIDAWQHSAKNIDAETLEENILSILLNGLSASGSKN